MVSWVGGLPNTETYKNYKIVFFRVLTKEDLFSETDKASRPRGVPQRTGHSHTLSLTHPFPQGPHRPPAFGFFVGEVFKAHGFYLLILGTLNINSGSKGYGSGIPLGVRFPFNLVSAQVTFYCRGSVSGGTCLYAIL